MEKKTIFLVGDSTVASFNDSYYYPRYGYGTMLYKYFNDSINIKNYALSGRSSRSYLNDNNYKFLLQEMKKGDYLLIGFGHNDEKNDDALRFTDASKPINDSTSFSYYLKKYYLDPAKKIGVIPILCTPVCRASRTEDYEHEAFHITAFGDYAQCIQKLGMKEDVLVIPLHSLTKDLYQGLGFQGARELHAVIAGKYHDNKKNILPDYHTVDTTHLNAYGASYVAYFIACTLKQSNCPLREFLKEDIKPPRKEDYPPNPKYEVQDYSPVDVSNYLPTKHFKTMSPGWYGTAFGKCEAIPNDESSYFAYEKEKNVFIVGEKDNKGGLAMFSDGFAYCFKQISGDENFFLSCKATILTTTNTKQAGFGIMLRDDCYLNQKTKNEQVASNYLAAGFITNEQTMNPIFYREHIDLYKEEPVLDFQYQRDDVAYLFVKRLGQTMSLEVKYKGKIYHKDFFDFDLFVIDSTYMYVGFFATKGTRVEFSEIQFDWLGKSKGA